MIVTVVGTCGICGGDVTVPSVWHSIIPAKPTCVQCGATAADPSKPVLPMNPPNKPFQKPMWEDHTK